METAHIGQIIAPRLGVSAIGYVLLKHEDDRAKAEAKAGALAARPR